MLDSPNVYQRRGSYAVEIPRAINDCKVFVLILSNKSQNSIWVPKELDQAINARKKLYLLLLKTPNFEYHSVYNTAEIELSSDAEIDFFGNIYTGAIQNSMPHCIGTMKYIGGTTYTGEWNDCIPNGKGTATNKTGLIYDGYWKNGLYDGIGKLT